MIGDTRKNSSHQPSSSFSLKKSRWESVTNPPSVHNSGAAGDSKSTKPSSNSKDDPASNPIPEPSKLQICSIPSSAPATFPPVNYGFQKLERRTIVLVDGSIRSYFALPPDFQVFPPSEQPVDSVKQFLPIGSEGRGVELGILGLGFDKSFHWGGSSSREGFSCDRNGMNVGGGMYGFCNSLELDGLCSMPLEGSLKRKYGDEDVQQRQQPLQDGTEGDGVELGSPGLGFDKSLGSGGSSSREGFNCDRDEMNVGGGKYDFCNSLELDGLCSMPLEGSLKRKYGDEDVQQKQQLLQDGNPSSNTNGVASGAGDCDEYLAGTSSPFSQDSVDSGQEIDVLRSSKHMKLGGDCDDLPSQLDVPGDDVSLVDPEALKKAFFRYVKSVNEDASRRKNYLENGKHGPLQCLVCGRDSKDFPDMDNLVIHTYNSQNSDLRVDHLGLHKALCVLMGWDYAKFPAYTKAYRSLPAGKAKFNKADLIMWPPLVIVNNTNTIRGSDGRMRGLKNKAMNEKLIALGFHGGTSKCLYGEDGHQGITLVKFPGDHPYGLKTAIRLAEFFEKEHHGRKSWSRAQLSKSLKDDENNPKLFKTQKKGVKERILYGYLGTASDLDLVNIDTRKNTLIVSKREKLSN